MYRLSRNANKYNQNTVNKVYLFTGKITYCSGVDRCLPANYKKINDLPYICIETNTPETQLQK